MTPREPRSLADALRDVRAEVAPPTLLGAVQEAWLAAVGEAIAAEGEPVSERDGVITVACRSATWAQELDLMQAELLERLREHLGEVPAHTPLRGLRFTADAARRDPRA
jgi:predicted nucleic acid-binding Zn ribbon protein